MHKNNAMASCCPPGSISSRNAAQAGAPTPPVGTDIVLDDAFKTRLYRVSPLSNCEIKAVVVLVHDIFGLSSGRTRHVADEIASWGYLVVAPDFYCDYEDKTTDYPTWRTFFTGPAVPAFVRRSRIPFAEVQARLEQSVLPWIATQTAAELPMGLLGFCWGGWAVTRIASLGKFKCAVGAHPAPDIQALQSSGPTTKQMYSQIKCPMLYLPARNDPAWIKEEGSAWLAIKQAAPQSSVRTFPTMEHGWVNRGDLRDESVLREVQNAMQSIKDFYAQYLVVM